MGRRTEAWARTSAVIRQDGISLVLTQIRRVQDRKRSVCRDYDEEIERLRNMLPTEHRP